MPLTTAYVLLKNPPTTFKCGCRKNPIMVTTFDRHIKTDTHRRYEAKQQRIRRRYIKK